MRRIKLFTFTAAFLTLSVVQAQVPETTSRPQSSQEITQIANGFLKEWLNHSLLAKKSELTYENVDWYQTSFGYYGIYSQGDQWYLARFDMDVVYVETMIEREWIDGQIPRHLNSAYRKSTYQSHTIESCWEGNEFGEKSYYLELTDAQGILSGIWVDGHGKFSMAPPAVTPAQMTQFVTAEK